VARRRHQASRYQTQRSGKRIVNVSSINNTVAWRSGVTSICKWRNAAHKKKKRRGEKKKKLAAGMARKLSHENQI